MWEVDEIAFDLVADLTDDPVMTVFITTPDGVLTVTGEPVERGATLVVRGIHMQGAGSNAIGNGNLMVMAQALLERMDYDGLEVEGAVRTTGANPGRRPGPFRFRRRVGPAPLAPPG
jgi:hypothetical protein